MILLCNCLLYTLPLSGFLKLIIKKLESGQSCFLYPYYQLWIGFILFFFYLLLNMNTDVSKTFVVMPLIIKQKRYLTFKSNSSKDSLVCHLLESFFQNLRKWLFDSYAQNRIQLEIFNFRLKYKVKVLF